ncbi:MAG: putative OB-fold protein, partial [Limisphaerales bacterium]
PGCLDGELEWQLASGLGEVYSYSIVRQSYHPFFRNLVPYVVAWVDLAEGPRLLTNVVECEVDAVSVGMPVEITWETHEEVSIPLVRKAPAME